MSRPGEDVRAPGPGTMSRPGEDVRAPGPGTEPRAVAQSSEMKFSTQTPAVVETRPRRHSHRAWRKSSVTSVEPEEFPVSSRKQQSTSRVRAKSSTDHDCVSLSDSVNSKEIALDFKRQSSVRAKSSSHDCVSLSDSLNSKEIALDFKRQSSSEKFPDATHFSNNEQRSSHSLETTSPDSQKPAEDSSRAELDIPSVFRHLEEVLHECVSSELRRLQRLLSDQCPGDEDRDQWKRPRAAVLDLTLHELQQMHLEPLADALRNRVSALVCQDQIKSKLKEKCRVVFEGILNPGKASSLDEIYTELHLTEGGASHMNEEHEVTQIQMKPSRSITTLTCADLFPAAPEGHKRTRAVLTKGVAGVGKTILTQKFSLDWAEGRNNQHLHFIFPFTFRELNRLREETVSLYELVARFFCKIVCRFEDFKCLFILDGLDESRLQLDFARAPSVSDVRERTSTEVLLVNLIRGTLLPSAQIWITTRPAADQIPASCVDMVTEVRGFTDAQKDIYFRRKFKDHERASKVVRHVKASRSVHSMCYIPVFSWITAKVMDHLLQAEDGQLPQTLTELYIHFLVVQAKISNVKYKDKSAADFQWASEVKNSLIFLSKLAFEQLQKGNLIFYQSDLGECGVDLAEASVYSGVFTQMFREESGLYQDKVFSFVHLSVQEFLAALHVHITFMDSGVNLLSEKLHFWSKLFSNRSYLIQFYRAAVDTALDSQNGRLDLFLRFLLGLSLECNQSLLRGLVKPTGSPQVNQETAQYLKSKLDAGLSVERNLTLLQCLIELKDRGLCEEVQAWLSSDKIPSQLSPAQWTALVCILLCTGEAEFDLSKYQQSETALLNLMPLVKQSTRALLSGCGLSVKACEVLGSILVSQCSVRELDLSYNPLQDPGVLLLCDALKKPGCALQTLRLGFCGLSVGSCEALVSVLDSGNHSLTELDLSNNDLQDSGVETLSSVLPRCGLETLRLSGCCVSGSGCASLVSALSAGCVSLKELDLSYNHPGDTEAKRLCHLFQPQNKLSLECGGEERLRKGFGKYACRLVFDPNTANRRITFSNNNRTISLEKEKQPYPDHTERFDYWKQVLCAEGLRGRSYWEVEWTGDVYIAVTYKSIKRRGTGEQSCFGKNGQSWSLGCTEGKFSVLHENRRRSFMVKTTNRVGVYLDWEGGVLSFYAVSPEQKIHLQTHRARFTEEVYPAFRIRTEPSDSCVTLCDLE